MSAVKTKNVTLSLPETLMRRFKVFAAEKDKSMSALMAELLENAIDSDSARQAAARRFLNRARNAPALGTGGKITWKREDLYDR